MAYIMISGLVEDCTLWVEKKHGNKNQHRKTDQTVHSSLQLVILVGFSCFVVDMCFDFRLGARRSSTSSGSRRLCCWPSTTD